MGIRRVRRAAGGGSGGGGPAPSKSKSKHSSSSGGVTSSYDGRAVGGVELSLSEKLMEQEFLSEQQQSSNQKPAAGRGPLMDSDHSSGKKKKQSSKSKSTQQPSPSSGESMDDNNSEGWSWASSSRGGNSLRGKLMRKMEIGGGGSPNNNSSGGGNNKFSMLKIASSIPGPFQHSKRNMNMVHHAFGEENRIKEKVLSVMNCTKSKSSQQQTYHGGDEDYDDEEMTVMTEKSSSFDKIRLAKIGLIAMMMFVVVFKLGRQRGRGFGVEYDADGSLSSMSFSALSSSLSMSEQYLRGGQQLSSTDGQLSSNSASSITGNNQQPLGGIEDENAIIHHAVFPTHLAHLSNLTSSYNPDVETPYFWDVHFSGETIAEAIFSHCHHLVQACEFGLRQPDYNEDKLDLFELDRTQYVNVDTTTKEGIHRASQLGLASSRLANVIISPHFHDMSSQIFTSFNPGRMFALFRHPVDRAIGHMHYLAKASWDPHYNPALRQMSIEQYAQSKYIENNWLTRFLVNKPGGKLTHADMVLAKKILKFKCLVGLFDDIEVSMARFQRYFGWNAQYTPEKKAEVVKCRSMAVARGDKNNLGHPISIKDGYGMPPSGSAVRAGSVAWNAIVRMNVFDMELYEFAKKIYRIQGEQIFDVVGYESPPVRSGGSEVDMDEVAAPQSGKSMAADTLFEGDQLSAPRPGKTMPFDSANDDMNAAQPGKIMTLDSEVEDESSAPGSHRKRHGRRHGKRMAVDETMTLDSVTDGLSPESAVENSVRFSYGTINQDVDKYCIKTEEVETMAGALRDLYEKHGVRVFPRNGFLLGIIRHGGFLPNEKRPDADLAIVSTDVDRLVETEGSDKNGLIRIGEFKLTQKNDEWARNHGDWVNWKGRDPVTGEQYPFLGVSISRGLFDEHAKAVYPYTHLAGTFFFPRLNIASYNHKSHTQEMLRYNSEGANYRLLDTDEMLSEDNNKDGLQIGTVFDTTFDCMTLKQFYFTTIYVPCDYEAILEAFYGRDWNHVESRGNGGKGSYPAAKLSDEESMQILQNGPKPLCA
ncbi:hypothetical protein ACHAXR_012231 [Thalassiosira sp. AJA248-18]